MDKRGKFKRTEEMNKKMSEKLKGRVFSESHIEKLRIASTGRKHSLETKLKLSQMRKGTQKGEKNNFYGKKHTEETKQKIRGSNHYNWNGGTQREKHNGDWRYKEWRSAVFQRDNWTCQTCHKRSKSGEPIILEAHHIKSWAGYIDLRYEINNGVTLCKDCHKLTKSYGKKFIKTD